MALNKVQYVDGQTVIAAQNLNDIQDEIIANGNKIGTAQLNTSSQNVSSATNELLYAKARVHDIANPYLDSSTYAVGDFCTRMDGTKPTGLYRCKVPINTPEAWTAAHWELVTVGAELKKKYEKPSGGIPKTDLASAVQTSLGKADTAIQLGLTGAAVGDLVRVAAVDANGKPTSWNHVPLNEITTDLKSHWSGVGMFRKIAVIGDSFASGAVSTDGGSTLHYDYTMSWIQVLARLWGIEGVNYSYGGATTRSMLDSTFYRYNQYGIGAVVSDLEAGLRPGLYIIALGFNDCSGSPNVPLGSSADIGTNADTYYGNYSRIITTIQSKAANAKIVCSTGWRKVNGSVPTRLPSYNEAVKAIAAHYNLPCIDVLDDKYFTSSEYLDGQPYNHPSSVQHAGMATGYSRLLAKMLIDNKSYFANYDNDAIICTASTCNENLLDNWYFVGGGSQQGGGQFPLNQRGLTSYTSANNYGPDRWKVITQPCTLSADGMTCAALAQSLEKDRIIDGQKYTLTILCSSGVVVKSGTLDSSASGWQISTTSSSVCWGGIRYNGGLWDMRITGSATVYAVKLEIGDQQSLVHKEDGIWKLNEIPDYQAELIKCKTSTADLTDAYANKVIAYNVSNKNLLDNWYFAGGGSHNGAGAFPINQRGKGSYEPNSVGAYTIDRWKMGLATGKLSLYAASMGGTNNFLLEQKIDKQFDQLKGKKFTISVIISRGLFSATGTFPDAVPSAATQYATITLNIDGSNAGYADVQVRASGDVYVRLRAYDGKTIYFVAAKLELGTEQTLAHQENGAWVLNEIPDYGEELAKCQRYLIAFKTSSNTRSFLALGFAESASQYRAVLPTPVTMNHSNNRPVELTGTVTAGSLTASSVSSFWEENPGSITLFVNVTGATVGDVTKIILEPSSTLTISAEL